MGIVPGAVLMKGMGRGKRAHAGHARPATTRGAAKGGTRRNLS